MPNPGMKHASRQSWRLCDSERLSFSRNLFVQQGFCLSRLRHPFIVRLKELLRNQLDGSLRLGRRHSAGFKPCHRARGQSDALVPRYYIFEYIDSDLCRLVRRCGGGKLAVVFLRYTKLGGLFAVLSVILAVEALRRQNPSGLDETFAAGLARQLFAGAQMPSEHCLLVKRSMSNPIRAESVSETLVFESSRPTRRSYACNACLSLSVIHFGNQRWRWVSSFCTWSAKEFVNVTVAAVMPLLPRPRAHSPTQFLSSLLGAEGCNR